MTLKHAMVSINMVAILPAITNHYVAQPWFFTSQPSPFEVSTAMYQVIIRHSGSTLWTQPRLPHHGHAMGSMAKQLLVQGFCSQRQVVGSQLGVFTQDLARGAHGAARVLPGSVVTWHGMTTVWWQHHGNLQVCFAYDVCFWDAFLLSLFLCLLFFFRISWMFLGTIRMGIRTVPIPTHPFLNP